MQVANLQGKKLLIVGGNGYVGSEVGRQALALGAHVMSVSRSGKPKRNEPWNDQIEWIKGDALTPASFEKKLEEADAVVHSLGTLIDTSFTRLSKPGQYGTYEHLNRETARAIGAKLEQIGGNKKITYISASKAPPFIKRYLTTKLEAENYLFGLKNVRASVLRPGFIYSSAPAATLINIYSDIFNGLFQFVKYDTALHKFLSNFDVDKAIKVEAVAVSALYTSFDGSFDGKILYNKDMEALYARFLADGFKI